MDVLIAKPCMLALYKSQTSEDHKFPLNIHMRRLVLEMDSALNTKGTRMWKIYMSEHINNWQNVGDQTPRWSECETACDSLGHHNELMPPNRQKFHVVPFNRYILPQNLLHSHSLGIGRILCSCNNVCTAALPPLEIYSKIWRWSKGHCKIVQTGGASVSSWCILGPKERDYQESEWHKASTSKFCWKLTASWIADVPSLCCQNANITRLTMSLWMT